MDSPELNANELQILEWPTFPVFYVYDRNRRELITNLQNLNIVTHEIDCSSINSEEDLFDRFAETLNFPDYFGKNWNALWDMLTDLSWLPEKNRVIILDNISHIGRQEPYMVNLMFEYLRDAAVYWAVPVKDDFRFLEHPSLALKIIMPNANNQEFGGLNLDELVGRRYHDTL